MGLKSTRRPKNEAEGELYDLMIEQGWKVTKRGWPDFFCWTDERFILVEVKREKGVALKAYQEMVMASLAELGVECYRYSPDVGFEKVEADGLDRKPPKSR